MSAISIEQYAELWLGINAAFQVLYIRFFRSELGHVSYYKNVINYDIKVEMRLKKKLIKSWVLKKIPSFFSIDIVKFYSGQFLCPWVEVVCELQVLSHILYYYTDHIAIQSLFFSPSLLVTAYWCPKSHKDGVPTSR